MSFFNSLTLRLVLVWLYKLGLKSSLGFFSLSSIGYQSLDHSQSELECSTNLENLPVRCLNFIHTSHHTNKNLGEFWNFHYCLEIWIDRYSETSSFIFKENVLIRPKNGEFNFDDWNDEFKTSRTFRLNRSESELQTRTWSLFKWPLTRVISKMP